MHEVSADVEIMLDGEKYVLEAGDKIQIVSETVTTGGIAIPPQPEPISEPTSKSITKSSPRRKRKKKEKGKALE